MAKAPQQYERLNKVLGEHGFSAYITKDGISFQTDTELVAIIPAVDVRGKPFLSVEVLDA